MTPENGKSLVQSYDCLDKVVIVDTAHKVRQEVLSNLKNMGKNILNYKRLCPSVCLCVSNIITQLSHWLSE